jgi:hypothetical protein
MLLKGGQLDLQKVAATTSSRSKLRLNQSNLFLSHCGKTISVGLKRDEERNAATVIGDFSEIGAKRPLRFDRFVARIIDSAGCPLSR